MSGKPGINAQPETGDFLTMAEAIEALKTTRATFNRWLKAGRVSGRKLGRQWRFSRTEIDRVLSGESAEAEWTSGLADLGARLGECLHDATGRPPPTVDSLCDLVDLLITVTVEMRGSDLHIDPRGHADPEVEIAELSSEAVIRIRIDGLLHRLVVFDLGLLPRILGFLKAKAGCDVREKTLPQDGRIRTRLVVGEGEERAFDLRVCFLPAALGECVTMRIFDQSRLFFSLERIGLGGADLERTRAALTAPRGMVVITGPTGSGKTTTHYSCLSEIVSADRKLMSIEDPVEHHLPGVVQVPIRAEAGMTFASAFRHVLRSDPDVILVGEIRDEETLTICCRASLTGHLVQTTLHTESAAAALVRMRDLGIEPFLLADAVTLVMAQRIVRVVCRECAEPRDPADAIVGRAKIIATAGGLDWQAASNRFLRPVGCSKCAAGYRGRTGIYETLVVSPDIREALREGASLREILATAIKEGMTTLEADGIRKAAEGRTTIEEVVRVLRPEVG